MAEVITNCRAIAEATDLPVSVDLKNCLAHEPEAAAETIRLGAEAGAVGGAIEDYTGDRTNPIYDFNLAVTRVRAAAQVAHTLPAPFLLTARAENLLHGRSDMVDTIRPLRAFAAAGADVLYAPGLRTLDEVREVVRAANRPVNVVTGWLDPDITLAQLSEVGAKQISVGGALSRLALATFVKAARAMQEQGSFTWMRDMIDMAELREAAPVLNWIRQKCVGSPRGGVRDYFSECLDAGVQRHGAGDVGAGPPADGPYSLRSRTVIAARAGSALGSGEGHRPPISRRPSDSRLFGPVD